MIDVTINDNPKAEKPFPKVMEITYENSRKGTLVFFSSYGTGTVIHSVNNSRCVGEKSASWLMEHFTDYDFDQPAKLEAEFPKLMITTKSSGVEGRVVLFQNDNSGTVIREGSGGANYGIGHFGKDWIIGAFEDFHGSITLKNK